MTQYDNEETCNEAAALPPTGSGVLPVLNSIFLKYVEVLTGVA